MTPPPALSTDPNDWPDDEHLFARLDNPLTAWTYIPLLRSDGSAMVLGQDDFPSVIWHRTVPAGHPQRPQPDTAPLFTYRDVGQEEERYPNVHSYKLEGLADETNPQHWLHAMLMAPRGSEGSADA